MNAKEELLHKLKDLSSVKCAEIRVGDDWSEEDNSNKFIILKLSYSKEEYDNFLSDLDFEYDAGYGGQVLFGTVWLEDNTWLSRGEYDGSEWWAYNTLPDIPNACL